MELTINKIKVTMEEELGKHYLYPSALFAEKKPFMVDTVLGSCVAVCLFDQKLNIGGINHYMLPFWNGNGLASPKYGNIATEKLVEKMLKNGATIQNMVAKVFGGANQMNTSMRIGDQNIEIARQTLANYGIKIIAENVGGGVGRKLRYNTSTGQVMMKFLTKSEGK
jgi:chemotaxis protein CheD